MARRISSSTTGRGAMHRAPPCCFVAPPVQQLRVADTDDGLSGKLYFDLDRDIVPDGLRVPTEITQVRRRRNSEGVALDACREVNHAISSNGARRDACIRDDVQVRVTCLSWLQDRCRQTAIGVYG